MMNFEAFVCGWGGTLLLAGTVGCDLGGGVSEVVEASRNVDLHLAEEEDREQAEVRSLATGIRASVQARLGMGPDSANSLEIVVMPNSKMLAGAQDPETKLCFALGREADAWNVFAMGTKLDVDQIRFQARDFGDGTHGAGIDVTEMASWAERFCPEGNQVAN